MHLGLYFIALDEVQQVMAAQAEDAGASAGCADGKRTVEQPNHATRPRAAVARLRGYRLARPKRASL